MNISGHQYFSWIPRFFVCAVLCLSLAGCQLNETTAHDKSIVVLAASSTAEAMSQAAKLFEQQTGLHVTISTGASNALAQQIMAGAPADLYLSANTSWARRVAENGQVATMKPFLSNRLVLIVSKASPTQIKNLEQLRTEGVKNIAIAGENVPAGIYAEQALRKHQLWEPLQSNAKIIRGHSVRTTLTYVQRGEVAAGIVYLSDAKLAQDSVMIVHHFDEDDHDAILYPLALIRHNSIKPASETFFQFLFNPEARQIFQYYGFHIAASTPFNKKMTRNGMQE